jgi:hypothetical protein
MLVNGQEGKQASNLHKVHRFGRRHGQANIWLGSTDRQDGGSTAVLRRQALQSRRGRCRTGAGARVGGKSRAERVERLRLEQDVGVVSFNKQHGALRLFYTDLATSSSRGDASREPSDVDYTSQSQSQSQSSRLVPLAIPALDRLAITRACRRVRCRVAMSCRLVCRRRRRRYSLDRIA